MHLSAMRQVQKRFIAQIVARVPQEISTPDEPKNPEARILIREDAALIAMDVERILRNLSYQVTDTVFRRRNRPSSRTGNSQKNGWQLY